jgi:hypothetical protein
MTVEPHNLASERVREDSPKYGDITFLRTQARNLLADSFVRDDRRSIVALPQTDADGWIEQVLTLHDLGSGSPQIQMEEVVAVRGERLALYRIGLDYPDGQDNHQLAITQFDAEVDLVERFITFDPDDVDAALDELNRLSADLDAGNR